MLQDAHDIDSIEVCIHYIHSADMALIGVHIDEESYKRIKGLLENMLAVLEIRKY